VGLADALRRYEEAAWLTTQYASNPEAYGDIQATIWRIFDADGPTPTTSEWTELAAENYQTIDRSRFQIVTNVGPVRATGQVQEFLIDPPPAAPIPPAVLAVSEPPGMLLLATAVGLSGWFMRRRHSSQG
jgi:hypothetical protein